MAGGVIDQIKSRLDVIDVVSDKVVLKKAGKSLKGLCPFHSEKTPSFIVFPETGTWHCFGCGAGGDIFGFVMQSQNLEFAEALSLLAARAGVELHQDRQERAEKGELERLYAANEAAASYFHSMLLGPAGTGASKYVEGRGLTRETIESFQLGFSPDSGAALAHHLIQQGIDRADVLQAGLAGENESGGLYDRFRGRLIFPIRDAGGRIVGFGGRAMASGVQPKYLNTPQTPLFDKGGTFYAIEKARQEIRRTSQAIIVEGYMDAIMAHQHGFHNVVASMGTAVTDRQVSQLRRIATELCFALDPDVAGQEATARGLEVAMGALERTATPIPSWKGLVEYVYQLKTSIKIISLPPGQDPDDLIRNSASEWVRLVQQAVPVQDFLLERIKSKHDLSTAAGKSAAVEEAMGVIGDIPDPVQQAHYVQRLARLVDVDESILLQRVRRRRGQGGRGPAPAGADKPRAQEASTEAYVLSLLLQVPSLLEAEPRISEEQFTDPGYREILRRLLIYMRSGKDGLELLESLRDEAGDSLGESLDHLLELRSQHPVHFPEDPEQEYKTAVITLLLGNLDLQRRQLELVMQESETGAEHDELESQARARLANIFSETHRLKLMGGIVPLRAIHKEVRHGG